jgi:hypothetical protein
MMVRSHYLWHNQIGIKKPIYFKTTPQVRDPKQLKNYCKREYQATEGKQPEKEK